MGFWHLSLCYVMDSYKQPHSTTEDLSEKAFQKSQKFLSNNIEGILIQLEL
jgi:hypothetical protein